MFTITKFPSDECCRGIIPDTERFMDILESNTCDIRGINNANCSLFGWFCGDKGNNIPPLVRKRTGFAGINFTIDFLSPVIAPLWFFCQTMTFLASIISGLISIINYHSLYIRLT